MESVTLTLVPVGPASEHEGFLESLRDAWPAHAPLPDFSVDPDALDPRDIAVLLLKDQAHESALVKMIDVLDDQRRTLVVVAPPDRIERLSRLGAGVVCLSNDLGAAPVAFALSALVQQRVGTRALLHEHDAFMRTHRGLAREMQHIREELQLAARVQREFMPKSLPETPGLEVASLFRPCGYVSGDIYDVVRLDERHVGFFIADAVGHGVPAALMTMVLSHGMCMKEIQGNEYRIIPPAEVLRRCNDALIAGNLPSDRFLTAAYGVIDTQSHVVELAGAGHPPPVLVGPSGSRSIETEGPLLGVFPGAEFDAVRFTIEPDETLVLYSDGFETAFPEAEDESGAFSRRMPTLHYLEHFKQVGGARAEDGCLTAAFAELARSVDSQNGSLHQVDDITALAFARAAKPALTAAA